MGGPNENELSFHSNDGERRLGESRALTTSLGMPSLSISLKISRAVLGCLDCTLTAMREFMQYVFGLRPASFIIWTACKMGKTCVSYAQTNRSDH